MFSVFARPSRSRTLGPTLPLAQGNGSSSRFYLLAAYPPTTPGGGVAYIPPRRLALMLGTALMLVTGALSGHARDCLRCLGCLRRLGLPPKARVASDG